jgi:hypothetical protein
MKGKDFLAMKRATISALLGCLLLGTVGCCNPCCQGGARNQMGCGKLYVSDWYEGMGCDPCDKCGNWTGSCGGFNRPWLDHWRNGCGGWYFPGLYGAAYGSRCQRCCGNGGSCGAGGCGNPGMQDDGHHGPVNGPYDGSPSDQGEVIYDGPVQGRPGQGPTVAPDSSSIAPPSTSTQQNQRQWRSLKTSR